MSIIIDMKKNNRLLILAAMLGGATLIITLAFIFTRNSDETTPTNTAENGTSEGGENGNNGRQPTLTPIPTPTPVPGPTPTGSLGIGDNFYPGLGNPSYDVLHYEIELDVAPLANSILATTLIKAQATEDFEMFNLDLSGLGVHSVTVDGAHATFTHIDQELTIWPMNSLAAGSQFETEIRYSGSPEPITNLGVPFSKLGWFNQDGVIYTVSQPSGSMTWFPSNNHPSDKATYEIRIIVPENFTAASNGILADKTTTNSKTTYTWRMDDPMATYLAAVYIGEFDRVDYGPLYAGGPLIRSYVPRDVSPEITQALSIIPEAIKFLEARLGPYPFDAYGIIVMPFPLGYALENQTLPVHGSDAISPDFIAHEIAHQWLGNSVTLDDWSEIWLNEGFATYLHFMFEAEYLDFNLNEMMIETHAYLFDTSTGPPKRIGAQNLFDFDIVYIRSATTLHALRLHVGDETFFEILRAHYERSLGATTNTGEFLDIVNEFAGPEAVHLVESWLYDEIVPASI